MGRHSCSLKQKLRKGLWSPEEDEKLFHYITIFGVGCWSSVPKLAAQLPGRTDNEIKNFWNSCLKKRLMKQGIDPATHKPFFNVTESVLKEENEKLSMLMPALSQPQTNLCSYSEALVMSDLNYHYNIGGLSFTEASRKILMNLDKPLLDPLCYNLSVSNYYSQPCLRQFEQNLFGSDSSYFFSSMPCLNSADNNNSVSEFGSLLVNENSCNSFSTMNDYQGCEMSSNMIENAGGLLSWEGENNILDPLLQFEVNAVKCEELLMNKTSSWQEGQFLTRNDSINFTTYS
ncbi:hypothetical protein RYX36_015410 [Vicia faba]